MVDEIKNGQKPKSGMYEQSKGQWNPFVGCGHKCIYCVKSFQRQYKRVGKRCLRCYNYEPHEHPERLNQSLPRTEKDEFIFTIAGGDISFASKEYIEKILDRIHQLPDRMFLIQTKNPHELFSKVNSFPENVYLDITLETNRDEDYRRISECAPLPSERFKAFLTFKHPHKFLTIEPIFDFDEEIFLSWVKQLDEDGSLDRVYIGYESKGICKKLGLPQPPLFKTKDFINKLREFVTVYPKSMDIKV